MSTVIVPARLPARRPSTPAASALPARLFISARTRFLAPFIPRTQSSFNNHPSIRTLAPAAQPLCIHGIFAFSSARIHRSFCEHHFPTLPTTVALLPAALAARKSPATRHRQKHHHRHHSAAAARRGPLSSSRLASVKPTSPSPHPASSTRAPPSGTGTSQAKRPSKSQRCQSTHRVYVRLKTQFQIPTPLFCTAWPREGSLPPRHLSILPVAFSHALPRSTDDDGSHRFHGLSFIRKRRRPESSGSGSGSGSPSSSGSDDSLIFPAAGPAPSSATENPTRAQAHDYEAAGALDHHHSAGGLDSATTTTTTATTSDADAASESTGKMPFRQRMARHFGESVG